MGNRTLLLVISFLTLMTAARFVSAEDDDPVVDGIKLSKLIAMFQKAAKSNDDKSVNARIDLAAAMARSQSLKACEFLGTVLKEDKSSTVKVNVAFALNMLGPKAKFMVPALIETLKDSDDEVRVSAIGALRAIGPDAKPAVRELLGLLKDKGQASEVRSTAATVLRDNGADAKEAVPILNEAMKDKDTRLRGSCAFCALQIR